MTVRPVRQLGDPILRVKCEAVKRVRSPGVRVVADDIQDTLIHLKKQFGRGRGLAAPQIGAPLRIIYLEAPKPCFMIPDLLVRVQRAHQVSVTYNDLAGRTHSIEATGDLAELLQHEIDHLDGVLMVDRPVGLDPFCVREEWEKHYASDGKYGAPHLRETVEPAY